MRHTDDSGSRDGREAHERARRAADRMRAVARAGAGLIGVHSVERLQSVLEEACGRVIPFDVFSLAIYDAQAHTLSFLMGDDQGTSVANLVVAVPGTPSEQVIRTRETLVTLHSGDPAGRGSVRVGSGRLSESVIRTPLLSDQGVVGTITVQSYTPDLYSPDDVEVVETLAALAAPALLNIQNQEVLRDAERRHRDLTDALPVMIYVAEPVEPYSAIYVNPTIASLGYSHQEWMEVPDLWTRILHPEDRAWVLAETEAALRVQGSTDYEYRVVTREGEVRWLHDRGQFVRDARGRPMAWQGVMVDITERRAAEAALNEQRTELRQIIDVVPHMLFVKDEDGRYVIVNRAFAAAYGVHPHEVVGKRDADLGVQPAEAERHRAEERDVMHTGMPRFLPGESQSDDGGREYDALRVVFHRAGTDQLGVLGLLRDVTEEKRQAEQLRRAQRLAAVGTLVGGVAHELNNPLSAVMGLSQLMLMDTQSEKDRESLTMIHREAGRMARIVADLRRIARGSQEAEAPRVAVNLNDVIRHVLRVRGYSLSTHNVRIVEDLDAGLGPVMADPGRLEQVVLNLVVNAEQAMASAAGHGTLVLRTRSGLQGNTLTVEDTGPGIALEDQERIFDPFWSTKAPGEGTGLGLSVVHGIVDGLGGRISVESQPKAGARFTVLLPHADARARTPEPPAAARDASPASRLRVLVVDDEPSVRTVLSLYLRRCGHEVDEAAEGGAALDLLDEAALHGRCYQAILSDLRMPGLDGSQLLARLREQGGGMDRRLVFLTGDAASPDAERLLQDSGIPVLLKPVDLGYIEEVIRRVADRCTAEEASPREVGS